METAGAFVDDKGGGNEIEGGIVSVGQEVPGSIANQHERKRLHVCFVHQGGLT